MPGISNDSENLKSLSNEGEPSSDLTLSEMPWTLAEDEGTLGQPGSHVTKESKNNKTLVNESEHI
jgi:hypothetical protein